MTQTKDPSACQASARHAEAKGAVLVEPEQLILSLFSGNGEGPCSAMAEQDRRSAPPAEKETCALEEQGKPPVRAVPMQP